MGLPAKIILIALGVILLIMLILSIIKTGKPFKAIVKTCATGIGALAAINLLGVFTGVTIPLNTISLVGVSILGAPGAAALLVANLVFK